MEAFDDLFLSGRWLMLAYEKKLTPLERLGLGIERMLKPSKATFYRGNLSWVPEIRVIDRRREIVVRLVSPEIDPMKIRIQLAGHLLTVSASTDDHGYRSFRRKIVLPKNIDARFSTAHAGKHFLSIRIPKRSGAG